MREPNFRQFQSQLLRVGISPRYVRRTVSELREHLDDLVDAELDAGRDLEDARRAAAQQIGDLREVAVAMRACPELRSWSYRFPRIAVVVYPLTCLALLPAVPVLAGIAHAPQLARWGACMVLGGTVTASMFLLLQLTISLS
ncbi:MAG: permease prefix domain 1-containing protein [Woeseiaceae bacterium]